MRSLAVLVLFSWLPSVSFAQERPLCHDWTECRQFALQAFADHDVEAFHDYARRALAAGPPRDAKLMYLLARAQSLSGRADDALQMLGRLAKMGVATDAATSSEFEAVRAAPGWADLVITLDQLKPRVRLVGTASPASTAGADVPKAERSAASSAPVPGNAPAAPVLPAATEPPAAPHALRAPRAPGIASETALRIPATQITPTGLAYDHVSGRFLLSDRDSKKLVSVDELSRHMVDLVKADSAGFQTISAFEIDTRRGDLWVVSAGGGETSDQPSATAVHKLQLVSGRPLARFPLDASFGAARFDDVAVSERGTVFALDGKGGRIFRLRPRATALALAVRLHIDRPVSLALTDERTALVAFNGGLARVDLVTGATTTVQAAKSVSLDGLERIRWEHGHLVATQRTSDGARHVMSIRIASAAAARASAAERLDSVDAVAGGTLSALSGEDVYFLTRETDHAGVDGEFVVHRARLH